MREIIQSIQFYDRNEHHLNSATDRILALLTPVANGEATHRELIERLRKAQSWQTKCLTTWQAIEDAVAALTKANGDAGAEDRAGIDWLQAELARTGELKISMNEEGSHLDADFNVGACVGTDLRELIWDAQYREKAAATRCPQPGSPSGS